MAGPMEANDSGADAPTRPRAELSTLVSYSGRFLWSAAIRCRRPLGFAPADAEPSTFRSIR